jgi:hypothetical protein
LELQTDDIEFDAYWSFRTELVLGQESDELEDEFFFWPGSVVTLF